MVTIENLKNLNSIEALISKALIDSNISDDEFVLINNVLNKTTSSYCLKCRKNTESKKPKVVRTKNGRIMLLSKCAVCDSKKSKFIKEHEASGLLSSLGIKTPLNKTPLLGLLLF